MRSTCYGARLGSREAEGSNSLTPTLAPRHSLPEAIPDPRIPTKNYGNAFLRALPKCPVEVV